MFSRVKVSSCNFLLPKLLDIRSETFCSFLFESHDYNVTQSKNCITVNNNYQSSLNNNIVDDCCFTACCHSSSQQEMFLLLTESSVCDRYRTFNWQSEVWLTDASSHDFQTSSWSPSVVRLCVSLCQRCCRFHNNNYSEGIPSYRGFNIGMSPEAEAQFQANKHIYSAVYVCSLNFTWNINLHFRESLTFRGLNSVDFGFLGQTCCFLTQKSERSMTSYHVPVEQVGKPVPVRLAIVRITS